LRAAEQAQALTETAERESPGLLRGRLWKGPWLPIITVLFLAALVAALIFHDLGLAKRDALNRWNALLTSLLDNQIAVSTIWLRERQMDAELLAENPATIALLEDKRKPAPATALRPDVERDLQRTIAARRLLGAVVLDRDCQTVAKVFAPGPVVEDFRAACERAQKRGGLEIVGSGMGEARVRVNLAFPVFAPGFESDRRIVGVVLLVADPWKSLEPYGAPAGEPGRSSEAELVWRRGDEALVFVPARLMRDQPSFFRKPIGDLSFESRVAREGNVSFGEFVDHRGIPVLGLGKKLASTGDNLACKVDLEEALTEYYRRARLETLAGALSILLFAFLMVAVNRQAATLELRDKLKQQDALLELQRDAEVAAARYRDLFENANDIIITYSLAGEVTAFNKAAQKTLGYSREEALTLTVLQLAPPVFHGRFPRIVEHLLAGKPLAMAEVELMAKDGSRLTLESNAQLIYEAGQATGLQVISRDVTERKHAQEALRESEERFRRLSEASFEGIGLTYEGRVIEANQRLAQMLGYEQQELIGMEVQRMVAPESLPSVLHHMRAGSEEPYENLTRRKDGSVFPVETLSRHLPWQGKTVRVTAIRDISERKRAQQALQNEKAFSDAVIDSLPGVVYIANQQGDVLRWNKNAEVILGYSRSELEGLESHEIIAPEDRALVAAKLQEAFTLGSAVTEARIVRKDGKKIPFLLTGVSTVFADSVYVVGTGIDISERKLAEEELRRSEELFRAIVSDQTEMIVRWKPGGVRTFVNQAYCRAFGRPPEQLVGTSFYPLISDADREMVVRKIESLTPERPIDTSVHRSVLPGGSLGWQEWTDRAIFDGQGRLLELQSVGRDITELKNAEDALRESDQRYRDFIRHSEEAVWRVEFAQPLPLDITPDQGFELFLRHAYVAECNEALARMWGFSSSAEIIGKPVRDFIRHDSEFPESFLSAARGGFVTRTVPVTVGNRAGQTRHLLRTEVPIIEKGMLQRIWGISRDVTDLEQAKQALRASEERYRLLFERNLAGVVRTSLDGRILDCNEAYRRIYGFESREEVLAVNVRGLFLDPADRESFINRLQQQKMVRGLELQVRRKSGESAWVLMSANLMEDVGEGPTILATVFDITQAKELSEQLRQAQKMEAVGRLAGGVAHDFNNMLQIINGFGELLLEELPPNDPMRELVQEIKKTVERAGRLPRQLLAFSRRQVLAPQILDLNIAVRNLSRMLPRLIGEDISLVISEGTNLSRVKADPGQIDQVIMNLAVNARDAMPDGGRLTIATADVKVDEAFALNHFPMTPGPFVTLAVSDTGCGMDENTQAHLFEPFFTTKESGKGTGLGLAMVYGIIKQSGGYVWIQSEVGRGTSVTIYLPSLRVAPVDQSPEVVTIPASGSETVLLVEDEKAVRSLVRRVLEGKGYKVLEAGNGPEALLVAEQHPSPIHLLMTDVVMPGMSGWELAQLLTSVHQEMKVLFMSGYADDAILDHGVLNSRAVLIPKPFTVDVLASTLRQVLGGR